MSSGFLTFPVKSTVYEQYVQYLLELVRMRKYRPKEIE